MELLQIKCPVLCQWVAISSQGKLAGSPCAGRETEAEGGAATCQKFPGKPMDEEGNATCALVSWLITKSSVRRVQPGKRKAYVCFWYLREYYTWRSTSGTHSSSSKQGRAKNLQEASWKTHVDKEPKQKSTKARADNTEQKQEHWGRGCGFLTMQTKRTFLCKGPGPQ